VAAGRVDAYYEQGLSPVGHERRAAHRRRGRRAGGGLRGRRRRATWCWPRRPGVFDALHDLLAGLDADRDPLAGAPGDVGC
jgi:myo-inositol-1(or 4)-monophosphatase